MTHEHFGTYLKKVRKENRFSLRELARQCGISHAYLSQIENSDKVPSFEIVKKISEVLGMEDSSLIIAAGYIDEVRMKNELEDVSRKIYHAEKMIAIRNEEIKQAEAIGDLDTAKKLINSKLVWEQNIILARQKQFALNSILNKEDQEESLNKLSGSLTSLINTIQNIKLNNVSDNFEATLSEQDNKYYINIPLPKTKISVSISDVTKKVVSKTVQITPNEAIQDFFEFKNLLKKFNGTLHIDGNILSESDIELIINVIDDVKNNFNFKQ